jgi:gluconate 2-dehydrogenase gamma chain
MSVASDSFRHYKQSTLMPSPFKPTRRTLLATTMAAFPVVALPARPVPSDSLEDVDLHRYEPVFFDSDEWRFVLSACDRLIPSEGRGPGALESNVPVFIDQQLHGGLGSDIYLKGPFRPAAPPTLGFQLPYSPQDVYRIGIRSAQLACRALHAKSLWQLEAAVVDDMLGSLQENRIHFANYGEPTLQAAQFFAQLLSDTKNGWLADPAYGGNKNMKAWVAIGFPGARAAFTEWVDQHDRPYPLGPVSLSGRRA